MRLAIIPARGGSKRIPRKNIRPFAGKPMIFYAIEAARACRVVDQVLVSTDDEEIAAIAQAGGAEVPFRRPAQLADDHTATGQVIAHAITTCRELGWDVADVCCIYPAVPFLRPEDLEEALRLLDGWDGFAFPVARFASPIQRALQRGPDGRLAPFHPEHTGTRTQDLEPAYYDAGQFYWGGAETWLKHRSIHSYARALVLPEWRAIDIDTEQDWVRAELLHRTLVAAEMA